MTNNTSLQFEIEKDSVSDSLNNNEHEYDFDPQALGLLLPLPVYISTQETRRGARDSIFVWGALALGANHAIMLTGITEPQDAPALIGKANTIGQVLDWLSDYQDSGIEVYTDTERIVDNLNILRAAQENKLNQETLETTRLFKQNIVWKTISDKMRQFSVFEAMLSKSDDPWMANLQGLVKLWAQQQA